jgi:SAM-dependent methyltransferase
VAGGAAEVSRVASDPEAAVRACYASWSGRYYDEYYGPGAPYPPVHRDLLVRLLRAHGARRVLDAGCGPASLLRHLAAEGFRVSGFDLTPEMVAEARRVLAPAGVPPARIWEGSVLAPEAFRPPGARRAPRFDAALCIGVLPHVAETAEAAVLRNLRDAVRPGGLVVVEARNQLFALFTLNRYSHRFFLDDLIRAEALVARAGPDGPKVEAALARLEARFRTDLPPVRRGTGEAPGYDEVLSRTHNPLTLAARVRAAGLRDVRVLFYHYHCLPPMVADELPELFRRESLAMEDPEDWRGYFMASAFVVAGTRA